MPRQQRNPEDAPTGPARYWMATIPVADFNSNIELPAGVAYIRGQQEIGEETGYHHWQLLFVLSRPQSKISI